MLGTHYALVYTKARGEQSIDIQGEDNKKREVGRERQQLHGEIMIQDQRAKAAVTWAMVEGVKSGFLDTWLVDKNKGDNYVVISLWLVTSLVVLYIVALYRTLHSMNC